MKLQSKLGQKQAILPPPFSPPHTKEITKRTTLQNKPRSVYEVTNCYRMK